MLREAELRPPALDVQLGKVRAVHQNASLGRREQPGRQVQDRGLARARGTDDGQPLARGQGEAQASEGGLGRARVAQGHVLETELPGEQGGP